VQWLRVLASSAVDRGLVGCWFSPGTLVSSTNKTDLHDITEILLKVALNTITPPHTRNMLIQSMTVQSSTFTLFRPKF
jgi:thioester reductase-like protein